jgi:hypothetical protein
MGVIHEIVFDCNNPAELARFWAKLLDGYDVRPYDEEEIARLATLGLTPETDTTVMVDGPGPSFCFQNVDGRVYDNNRVHLDIETEGNQFCLVDQRIPTMAAA